MIVLMKAGNKFRKLSDKPTAIFAGNDVLAAGMLNGIQDNGFISSR